MEQHPTVCFVTRLHQVLDEVMAGSPAGLTAAAAGDAAVRIAKAEARLSALRLRLLDQARRADSSAAQESVSEGWWAEAASVEQRRSRKDFTLARLLSETLHRTGAALAAGEVTNAQAEVIAEAVGALPATVGPAGREKAEQHLLEQAAQFNPKQLRLLGRHLIDVIDPDAAEQRLAAQLEAEERRAARHCFLQVFADERGVTHLRGAIPTFAGDQLLTALNAFASPRRPSAFNRTDAIGAKVANAELLGQAFVEMISRYPADRLPQSGGTNATVLVTMSLQTLLGGAGPADLLTDHQLSAPQARRLACESGIIPVVLGGDSRPLDYGREKRFHTTGQRRVIFARDKTCRAEGCEIPANWCHVHHPDPWTQLGRPASTMPSRSAPDTTPRLTTPRTRRVEAPTADCDSPDFDTDRPAIRSVLATRSRSARTADERTTTRSDLLCFRVRSLRPPPRSGVLRHRGQYQRCALGRRVRSW